MNTLLYPHGGARDAATDADSGISFEGIVALYSRHRALVLAIAAFAAIVVIAAGLLSDRTYSSTATFLPQASSQASSISGLAAQFGVALPAGDAAQSPQFYVDLLHSPQILEPVADAQYRVATPNGVIVRDLGFFYKVHASSPPLRREKVVKALIDHLSAGADPKTNVVTLSVRAPYPALAQELATRVLDRLNEFNLKGRQSRASAERVFTERRLAEVGAELHQAENQLESFMESNRQYRTSPQLTLEADRLARDVSMHQQVYTSLAQAYEQAKINEVRDLPVITVITTPEMPVLPDPRGLLKKAIFALVAGGALGLALAYVLDRRRTGRRA